LRWERRVRKEILGGFSHRRTRLQKYCAVPTDRSKQRTQEYWWRRQQYEKTQEEAQRELFPLEKYGTYPLDRHYDLSAYVTTLFIHASGNNIFALLCGPKERYFAPLPSPLAIFTHIVLQRHTCHNKRRVGAFSLAP
jgi:hypothetical protein